MSAACQPSRDSSQVQAVPYCAPCLTPISTAIDDAFPQLLPCGHIACKLCAEEAARVDPPMCPVCGKHSTSFRPDAAMAAFAEACAGVDAASRTLLSEVLTGTSVPLRCHKHVSEPINQLCVSDGALLCRLCSASEHREDGHSVLHLTSASAQPQLRERMHSVSQKCSTGAVHAVYAHGLLEQSRARLVARASAAVQKLDSDAASIKAAVEAHVRTVKAQVDREVKARLKMLDHQLDALLVAGSQLSCTASMCQRVLSGGDAAPLWELVHAYDSAQQVSVLAQSYSGPCVSSVLDVVSAVGEFAAAFAHVRTGIDATKSVVSGPAFPEFQHKDNGEIVENSITFALRDANNAAVDNLVLEDVSVSARMLKAVPSTATDARLGAGCGGDGSVARRGQEVTVCGVRNEGGGVFEVLFTAEEGVAECEIAVCVGGDSRVAAVVTARPVGPLVRRRLHLFMRGQITMETYEEDDPADPLGPKYVMYVHNNQPNPMDFFVSWSTTHIRNPNFEVPPGTLHIEIPARE